MKSDISSTQGTRAVVPALRGQQALGVVVGWWVRVSVRGVVVVAEVIAAGVIRLREGSRVRGSPGGLAAALHDGICREGKAFIGGCVYGMWHTGADCYEKASPYNRNTYRFANNSQRGRARGAAGACVRWYGGERDGVGGG